MGYPNRVGRKSLNIRILWTWRYNANPVQKALLVAVATGFTAYALAIYQSKRDGTLGQGKSVYKPPTREGFQAALANIRQALPEDCVSTDIGDLVEHGTTEWTCMVPIQYKLARS